MKIRYFSFLIVLVSFIIPKSALAHCPLCTAGAGVLAVTAAYIGINTVVVGIFIGAFSLALGLWLSNVVKKEYIQHQKTLLTFIIFLGTVIPIMPFVREEQSVYVSLWGEYGGMLHNTYTVNLFLLGTLIGAAILFLSPSLSKFITSRRNGIIAPFQGLIITFILLILVSVILQILI